MDDFYVDMGITVLLRLLKTKSAKTIEKWEKAMRKLFVAILSLYPQFADDVPSILSKKKIQVKEID